MSFFISCPWFKFHIILLQTRDHTLQLVKLKITKICTKDKIE